MVIRALCVMVAGLIISRGFWKRFLAQAIFASRMGYLTLAFTGKFLYLAHNFILLGHNVSGFGVDREGWWFEHSVSWFWVWLSVGVARNVSWHWLSPLWWWGSLIVAFTGKFVCVAHHFILLQHNAFGFGVDREGGRFKHPVSWLRV